jgi:hypothetical protein
LKFYALYNLETDVAEKNNLIAEFPEVRERLMSLAQKARADIGDYQVKGSGQRDAGWVENQKPLLINKRDCRKTEFIFRI